VPLTRMALERDHDDLPNRVCCDALWARQVCRARVGAKEECGALTRADCSSPVTGRDSDCARVKCSMSTHVSLSPLSNSFAVLLRMSNTTVVMMLLMPQTMPDDLCHRHTWLGVDATAPVRPPLDLPDWVFALWTTRKSNKPRNAIYFHLFS
jgi:hypothetical protein